MIYKYLLVFLSFSLWSCNLVVPSTAINSTINRSLIKRINYANENIIYSLSKNDWDSFSSYCSKKFRNTVGDVKLKKIVGTMGSVIDSIEFNVIDNFHVKNLPIGSDINLFGEGYQIVCNSIEKEMFTSVLEIYTKRNVSLLAVFIYSNNDDGWKLEMCRLGNYKYLGYSTNSFYVMAKRTYEAGYLLNSALHSNHLVDQVNPIPGIWSYDNGYEMDSFARMILNEVNDKYKFPIKLQLENSVVEIIGIDSHVFNGESYPRINYLSEITSNESKKLEYKSLSVEAEKKFNDLNFNVDYIFYNSINKNSDESELIKSKIFKDERK